MQAKNVIIKAFSNFQLTELLYLSCEQSSVMKKAATQMPNGDDLLGREAYAIFSNKSLKPPAWDRQVNLSVL